MKKRRRKVVFHAWDVEKLLEQEVADPTPKKRKPKVKKETTPASYSPHRHE
jgi:hypothetical protein